MIDPPLLAPPPRTVPASLRLRVLLGGVFATVAMAMLAIGVPLSIGLLRHSEFVSAARFAGPLGTTEGTVVQTTRMPIRLNNRRVSRIDFHYSIDQRTYEGRSYTEAPPPRSGDKVAVEFVVTEVTTARVRNMRSAPLPEATAFVLVLPALAVLLLTMGVMANRRRLGLMHTGVAAWGLLTATSPTRTRVNNQRVHRLEFTFLDAGGVRRAVVESSHRPEFRDAQIARLVLYDPASLRACLPDLTPASPRPVDGAWAPLRPSSVLPVLVLPTLAMIATALTSALA